MSVSDFLNALFGSHEGYIPFDVGGARVLAFGPSELHVNDAACYSDMDNQYFFCSAFIENVEKDHWQNCRMKPSAALWREGNMICCWGFEAAVDSQDADLQWLINFFDMREEEAIPIPPTHGWELVHCDSDVYYSAKQLRDEYDVPEEIGAEEPEEIVQAIETQAPQMYGDAVILAPYRETDYEFPIIATFGGRRDSKDWQPKEMPLAGLIGVLCQHKVGDKDGLSVVFGDLVPGQRLKQSVKSVMAIGIDIDTGTPTEVVDAALLKLGNLAVRYSTHSHNKKTSDFKKDNVVKHYPDKEINTELMREYCASIEHWDRTVADSVKYIEQDHTDRGIMIRVSHIPMPKHRVVVPMSTPYIIEKEGKTQLEAIKKWAKYPEALAAILKVPFDQSCTDPCRLFYLPRHKKGAEFSTSVFGGPLFDRSTLDLGGEYDIVLNLLDKKKGKTKTPEGRALGKWSITTADGFQIAQVLEDHCHEKLRGRGTMGYNIECPFDSGHSNAGDQDDRACYAVNAAEGGNEVFIISCRHETCREFTMLDMLGKMVKDNWFDETVLNDPEYNIKANEEIETRTPEAQAILKEAEIRHTYEDAIETLSEDSSEEDIKRVSRLVIEADLGSFEKSKALDKMKKQTKVALNFLKGYLTKIEQEMKDEKEKETDSGDRRIFRFEGTGFNFHDATTTCIRTLQLENMRKNPVTGLMEQFPKWAHMEGVPVRLEMDAKTEKMKFTEVNDSMLWAELCSRVVFCRKAEYTDGPYEQVPSSVSEYVFNTFGSNFPEAPEIVYTPLFAPNGSLIDRPGYYTAPQYPGMNLLLADNALDVGEIARHPTADQADAALEFIREELLIDFPFMDKDEDGNKVREPSEANALALLITPFMRRMITSCTPVFFITKPMAGTGGTVLGRLPLTLFDGFYESPARYSQSEEEMNKSLVAEIMQAKTFLFFDDVKQFDSREILRAVTSKTIGGRVLGGSKTINRPNNYIWIVTGNNPIVGNEMERRLLYIRLNAETHDTQKRKFKHNLDEFLLGATVPVKTEGERLTAVRAILTLIQYWISLEMPIFTDRTKLSFEDWAAKVGGVLQVNGVTGFLNNKRDVGQDIEEAAAKNFVKEFLKRFGADHLVTPIELYKWAADADLDIIDGANDDQKKSRFLKRLPTVDGRTFSFDDVDYMIGSGTNTDGDTAYFLIRIDKEEVAAA